MSTEAAYQRTRRQSERRREAIDLPCSRPPATAKDRYPGRGLSPLDICAVNDDCTQATAGVDMDLDARIQASLRTATALGKGSTVFIIAHRVWTIDSADLILVLDAGRLVELAPPAQLLAEPKSAFFAMYEASCVANGISNSSFPTSKQAASCDEDRQA